ncbi:MAG: hypothetical protein J6P03_03950 [Opitutales bacterium]|nr:hypothetical protein [Opitutales bacterium]
MEKSLYYQGFGKEVLNSLTGDESVDAHCKNLYEISEPSAEDRTPKILDAQKSFFFAQKAYENKGEIHSPYVNANLAKHYICAIGTKADYKKALALINEEDYELRLLKAYMYYKGLGAEKNGEQFAFLLKTAFHIWDEYRTLGWENFYTGKFAPRDADFAVFVMERWTNKLSSAYIMHLIYSGRLSVKAEENPEKAAAYFDKFESLKNGKISKILDGWLRGIQEAKSKSAKDGKYKLKEAEIYLKKDEVVFAALNRIYAVKNPYYNPPLAKEIMGGFYKGGLFMAYFAMIKSACDNSDFDGAQEFLGEALRDEALSEKQKSVLKDFADSLKKQHFENQENPRDNPVKIYL